ncbi:GspH/FimT family pseudopilin [Oceanimonas marisflavi]|uniref:GspH/FimT family pseudopilin n=1 Tax=Oceanimonas marisflavi TaxID=2059724 RepID=UPI0013004E16|nr:GspH/FimT family pseudopilin [Oceanimonas marisflavi]
MPAVPERCHGRSLTELLLVVTLLGTLALVAVPSLTAQGPERVELATTEVAGAIRFARNEARRSGAEHGVLLDTAAQRLQVYRIDDSGPSPVVTFDVYHPLDKQRYELSFATDARYHPVRLDDATFVYQGLATGQQDIRFLSSGEPYYLDSSTRRMLVSGAVILSDGRHRRQLTVIPGTGRITWQ